MELSPNPCRAGLMVPMQFPGGRNGPCLWKWIPRGPVSKKTGAPKGVVRGSAVQLQIDVMDTD